MAFTVCVVGNAILMGGFANASLFELSLIVGLPTMFLLILKALSEKSRTFVLLTVVMLMCDVAFSI